MDTMVKATTPPVRGRRAPRMDAFFHQGFPVLVVLLAVLLLWYLAAWMLNAPGAIERVLDADAGYTWQELFSATMSMERPLMPAPHQVVLDFWSSLTDWPVDSPRNWLYTWP
jgi:NitT/TauT family transport system permease protein